MFKKSMMMSLAVAVLAGVSACSDDDDGPFEESAKFEQALENYCPDMKLTGWEKEGAYRVAEGYVGINSVEVWFDKDAKWVMTETDYGRDTSTLPQAVMQQITGSSYATWTVDDVNFYERPDMDFYEIELETTGQKDVYMFISYSGTLLNIAYSDVDVNPTTTFPTN